MKAFNRFYDDFQVGEAIEHDTSKTVFESDNNLFSLLTMNHHPVHTNVHFVEKHQHGKVLVVGTLVFSLVVGLTVPDISFNAVANLEYEEVKHLNPVFINDTIYASTTVLEKWETKSNKNRGIVYVNTVAKNQNGEKILSFKRKILIPKK